LADVAFGFLPAAAVFDEAATLDDTFLSAAALAAFFGSFPSR
jgi:hypothetical protein